MQTRLTVAAAFLVASSCTAPSHMLPKPRSVPEETAKCSTGWYHLRGGGDLCYTVGTYGWWTVARAKCQSYGGDLASVTNEELNDELTAWTSEMFLDTGFWIGLTTNDSGELVWTDGSPVNYTNWADDYSHDDSNLIYFGYDGKWRADDMEDAFAYICEKAPEK